MISGWDVHITIMFVRDKWRFTLPPTMGYGAITLPPTMRYGAKGTREIIGNA